MTAQAIEGFKPLVTHHCVTGSMRHVYEFHRYPISEDMLLGLGSGVGFVYWHMKGSLPFYGGRANTGRPGEEGLEKTAGRRTGVRIERFTTGSARRAESALLDMLARGEPVMLQVDMGFLPYFDFPEEYHFGGHVVVAAGYKPGDGRGGAEGDRGQVLIADRDGVLHPVFLEDLARARGSRYKPFPPGHAWYTFDFSQARPPQPGEVREAICETAAGMLHPPISNLGVPGIRTAARRTPKWPGTMTEEELRRACFNIYIFIDAAGGTGGGLFRTMYARFLQEAAALLEDSRLAAAAEELHQIGDCWQAVAQIFQAAQAAPDPAAILPEVTRPLLAIAEREQAVWERLRET